MALTDFIIECDEVSALPSTGDEGVFYAVNPNLEGEFIPEADLELYIWENAQMKFIGHRPPRRPGS